MLNYENANYNELFNYSYSHYRKYLKEYPMTNRTFIIILLSLTTIIQIINSASSPPIWVASSFFKAGNPISTQEPSPSLSPLSPSPLKTQQ